MAYSKVNQYYNNEYSQEEITKELEHIAITNDFDILIKNNENENIYISNKDFFTGLFQMTMMTSRENINRNDIIEKKEKHLIIQQIYII